MTDAAAIDLRDLGPETWGDRFTRAGKGHSNVAAARYVSTYLPCDDSTLSRMQSLPVRPEGGVGARRRAIAYILCVGLYGVRPSELGLNDDDLPPGLTITPAEVLLAPSTCIALVPRAA